MPYTLPPLPEKPKKKRAKYRKTDDRGDLEALLKEWRRTACTSSPTLQPWDESLILSDEDITKLAMADTKKLQSASDVIELLDESPDWALYWADRILKVITGYNADTGRFLRRIRAKKQAERAAAGESEPEYESEERDPHSSSEEKSALDDKDSESETSSDDLPVMRTEPPWSLIDNNTPVPMDEDINILLSEPLVDPSSNVNKLVSAKESLIAGNSYSVKCARQARNKSSNSRSNLQNRPLFSHTPLVLKNETRMNGSPIAAPLQDKTNGNTSTMSAVPIDVDTQ